MSERWAIAPTLPITIVTVASTASAGAHSKRRARADRIAAAKIAKAAAFVATAMNVVTGVGRTLVDVRRPLVEEGTRDLEGQATAAGPIPVSSEAVDDSTLLPTAPADCPRCVEPVAP